MYTSHFVRYIQARGAALGLYTLGVLGRLMAEATENLDDRPLRALKAHGATGDQAFAYGVLTTLIMTVWRIVSDQAEWVPLVFVSASSPP